MVTKNKSNENEFISTDSVAVDSKHKSITPTIAEVKLYGVPIKGSIQAWLTGTVYIYARSEEEAISKVQTQIDTDTVDNDIEMEDYDTGFTMFYRDTQRLGCDVEIVESDIEVETLDEADLDDVLRDDVKQLEAQISWDADTLTKQKAFLESLMVAAEVGTAA